MRNFGSYLWRAFCIKKLVRVLQVDQVNIMNDSNLSVEGKTKNITLRFVLAWILGTLFLVSGLILLFSDPIVGVAFILCSFLMLPPATDFLKKKVGFSLSGGLRFVLVVVLICIAVGTAAAGKNNTGAGNVGSTASANTQSTQAPIVVSASTLSTAYQGNEVAADAKYKGNLVQVNGIVYNVGKDITNTPYVELQAGQYDPFGIQCFFSQDDEAALAQVSSGQSITLEGTVSGKEINVLVEGCRIVN